MDAGTEPYFQQVDRTSIPLRRILDNITAAARRRPLVIQTLLMRIHDLPPPADELEALCSRLLEITAAGGRLRLVQIYTIARQPAESFVKPLTDQQLDEIVTLVRQRTGLPVAGYYGTHSDGADRS